MKPRVFAVFVAPSVLLMLLFIAAPLVSVFVQSFHNTVTLFEEKEVESCSPGFPDPVCTKERKTEPLRDAAGLAVTRSAYVGGQNYANVLETGAVRVALSAAGAGYADLMKIDFYRALQFTLLFTFVTLPLVIGFGLLLAMSVNSVVRSLRGPVIFCSLLPFIITPVIGALSIRWLFVSDGILTHAIEAIVGHDISVFSHAWSVELLMVFYKVWNAAPFAFITFYAALQTISSDSMDAAVVDGASRLERVRFVILPHLAPVIVFVSLIHLMDSYRVFDEVVGFNAESQVISLQWLTFHYLLPDPGAERAIGRASASSMLTMIGIVLLLTPLIVRTWREQRLAWGRR